MLGARYACRVDRAADIWTVQRPSPAPIVLDKPILSDTGLAVDRHQPGGASLVARLRTHPNRQNSTVRFRVCRALGYGARRRQGERNTGVSK